MRFFLTIVLLFSLTLTKADEGKRNALGIGNYVTVIDFDDEPKIRLNGFAVNYSFAFKNWLAVKAEGYRQEDDEIRVHGVDVCALLGHNLINNGFTIYFKGGMFLERMDSGPFGDELYSGALLGVGLGWNWTRIRADLWMAWRDQNAYEESNDVNAGSAGLSIAYRF